MDASYKIQRGIHVHLIQFFMCPEFWVHIKANRFGLRFLYFAAGRENNQLERFSNDRIATPSTKQGFLEFKESKTRLLHGNKLRQQIVGDYLRGVGIFRQIGIFDGLDA